MTTERPRLRDRLKPSAPLPAAFQRGTETRRWISLSVRAAVTVVNVGFLVIGTGMVSIGLTVMLNGLGVLDLVLVDDLGQSLAVGLVLAMIGGFALGVAVEGPIGTSPPAPTTKPWEALVASVPSMLLFVWFLTLVERLADRFLLPYSELFAWVSAHIGAVRQAGLVTGLLVGVPMMWAMRQFLVPKAPLLVGASPGALYVVWMIGVVALY